MTYLTEASIYDESLAFCEHLVSASRSLAFHLENSHYHSTSQSSSLVIVHLYFFIRKYGFCLYHF